MKGTSTPPPANSMQVLSADLLCRAAKAVVEQLACAKDWQPMVDLRRAVECYTEIRTGNVVKAAEGDPQRMNCENAQVTERSEARRA